MCKSTNKESKRRWSTKLVFDQNKITSNIIAKKTIQNQPTDKMSFENLLTWLTCWKMMILRVNFLDDNLSNAKCDYLLRAFKNSLYSPDTKKIVKIETRNITAASFSENQKQETGEPSVIQTFKRLLWLPKTKILKIIRMMGKQENWGPYFEKYKGTIESQRKNLRTKRHIKCDNYVMSHCWIIVYPENKYWCNKKRENVMTKKIKEFANLTIWYAKLK